MKWHHALCPIVIDNVRGAIVPGMGDDILLGMSFLGHLNMQFSGDRLLLR